VKGRSHSLEGDGTGLDRGKLLKTGLAVGGLAALGAAPAAGAAVDRSSRSTGKTVWVDVACLGDTLRFMTPPGANPGGDSRGIMFSVEGIMYAKGVVHNGFNFPKSAKPVGRWICRGWFMAYAGRPAPQFVTTQTYVWGVGPNGDFTASNLFPADQITSDGMEGTNDPKQAPVRSVVGGTGKYNGAGGTVIQHPLGKNTSKAVRLNIYADNYRFEFRLT
jgi:hypothetical protein